MIAISTGPFTHLDHLAPICEALNIPCIVDSEKAFSIGKKFYPQIDIQLKHPADLTLDFLGRWEAIFTCGKFWALELKPLLEQMLGRSPRFILCPHGFSDKEAHLLRDEKVVWQDTALAYGYRMEKQLERNGAKEIWSMGNMRLAFYQKYKSHFDSLSQENIPFHPTKKTILYAPTWKTDATSSSFAKDAEKMIANLSRDYHVLVKPHPLLEETEPAAYYFLQGKCQKGTFIEDFPAIYPLLSKTDIYLGDFSSIGYDFLYFNRPLFFLEEGKDADFLRRCGKMAGNFSDRQKELSTIRKGTYLDVFEKKEKPHFLEKMGRNNYSDSSTSTAATSSCCSSGT